MEGGRGGGREGNIGFNKLRTCIYMQYMCSGYIKQSAISKTTRAALLGASPGSMSCAVQSTVHVHVGHTCTCMHNYTASKNASFSVSCPDHVTHCGHRRHTCISYTVCMNVYTGTSTNTACVLSHLNCFSSLH